MVDETKQIHQIVPGKSDRELADEIKAKVIAAYETVIPVLQEAHNKGFQVNAGIGISQFGQVHIAHVIISKEFK